MSDRTDFSAFADEDREDRVIAGAMARLRRLPRQPADLASAILAAAPAALAAALLTAAAVSYGSSRSAVRTGDQVGAALLNPAAARLEQLGPTPSPARLLAVLEEL